ncbi:hypothetical protein RXV94_00285 [Yeosuana sp. MJ-SS3]|jgi:hypothetical protein|uniref:Uncharacterized protein n=1 Tax=Gilvirhabdus luticola TaxID=3079858 RepID=A0ABU3U2E0_9FLAO|nr:hypothetical protein [Yeosuana sp. MJ-SS3]MDU8884575.1 hypothetical protein [Yeosuana sp. MJ-SS3]
MIKFIKKLKKTSLIHVNKEVKKCKHEFEIGDVLNFKKDPLCYKCGKALSELPAIL